MSFVASIEYKNAESFTSTIIFVMYYSKKNQVFSSFRKLLFFTYAYMSIIVVNQNLLLRHVWQFFSSNMSSPFECLCLCLSFEDVKEY